MLTRSLDDLVVHCAVLAKPCPEANELLEYVVEACPIALGKKNTNGETPLMVACRLGRVEFAKILIDANADQSVRNLKGENILHVALSKNPKAHQLKPLFDLFDADLRSHLFLQRKNLNENGTTPLHAWISQASGVQEDSGNYRYRYNYYNYNSKPYNKDNDIVDMLKLLLEYSKGEELEMLNGAGDTCLHTAIMNDMVSLVSALAKFKPRLLYRENAVGRTPAEVAQDRLTGVNFAKPEALKLHKHGRLDNIVGQKPEDFAELAIIRAKTDEQARELLLGAGLSGYYGKDNILKVLAALGTGHKYDGAALDDNAKKQVIWDLCSTTMEKHPEKRRLVSLNEANDVAKRLGEKYSASRYFSVQAQQDDSDADEEDKEDKVDKTTVDFSVSELNSRIGLAWKEEQNKDGNEDSDGESRSSSYCTSCGEYH